MPMTRKDSTYEHAKHIATGKPVTAIGPQGWVNDIDNADLVHPAELDHARPSGRMAGRFGTPFSVVKAGRNTGSNS